MKLIKLITFEVLVFFKHQGTRVFSSPFSFTCLIFSDRLCFWRCKGRLADFTIYGLILSNWANMCESWFLRLFQHTGLEHTPLATFTNRLCLWIPFIVGQGDCLGCVVTFPALDSAGISIPLRISGWTDPDHPGFVWIFTCLYCRGVYILYRSSKWRLERPQRGVFGYLGDDIYIYIITQEVQVNQTLLAPRIRNPNDPWIIRTKPATNCLGDFPDFQGIYKSTRKRWWLTPKPTKMEPKWCKNASKNWPQKNPKKTSGGRISEPHGVSPYPPQDNLTAWQNLQSLPHSVHESDETWDGSQVLVWKLLGRTCSRDRFFWLENGWRFWKKCTLRIFCD